MKSPSEFIIAEESAWLGFWQSFLAGRSPKLLLLLEGDVGAGKTTSVSQLAKALGASQTASPSFAIHHRYQGSKGSIDHVDLYRIESEAELDGTGFWDLFLQPSAVVVVEWPSRVPEEHWPLGWEIWKLQYQKIDEQKRRVITQLF